VAAVGICEYGRQRHWECWRHCIIMKHSRQALGARNFDGSAICETWRDEGSVTRSAGQWYMCEHGRQRLSAGVQRQ
jgi:hypothetical protein